MFGIVTGQPIKIIYLP